MNGLSTVEFLAYLRSLNVKLSADGQHLRYDAPAGVVTSALKSELTARKPEILEFFKEARLAVQSQPSTIKAIPRSGDLPLSFGQMRLWWLDQLEPGGTTYTIPSLFRFRGDFDLAVFEQSLSEIVRRHEVLRTCFVSVDGFPVQKIAPPNEFKISVHDLQALEETARQNEAARLALLDAAQPFDLGQPPLMRATLLKLTPKEQVLLLNVHHIAFDGWSVGVFARELSVLYQAFLNGEPSPLPELSIQYVDFAAWQQQWMLGEVLQAQLYYWKERLGGSLPVLELPTDRPRPAVQTYNGGNVSFAFSKRLTDALNILSQKEDVTLFVTLLAAFKILLLRYTGQEDIIVGTPIANRNRAEIEVLIGFFVNMLVMRTDLSGNPTFRELVRRVQDTALGAYAHQDLPFERLVEELHPKRDISRSPVFQVMFTLLNTPMQSLELHGLAPSRLEFHNGGAKFDLSLYLEETHQRLTGWFSYNTDLFDEATVSRMVTHFETLLEGIVSTPEQRLHDLPLLSRWERAQLLVKWNDTKMEYPADLSVAALFEKQVQQTPDAVAVVCGKQQLTYGELNQRANQLAHYLRRVGVGPDTVAGICMERSVEMVVGLLAILKAGGAYIPLDPTYPKDRLRFMLEDSAAPVLLTCGEKAEGWPGLFTGVWTPTGSDGSSSRGPNPCVVRLDKDWNAIARESTANPREASTAADLAYVIYTSGSTGKPKGVQISHRSVVNFLTSMRRQPGFTENDVVLAVTTLSFDIAGLELYLPLTTGARVVVVSREAAMDGQRLIRELERSRATVVQATPATWRLLLESGWQGNPNLKILCGGEAWSQNLAERLLPRCGSLWNMYGPTETTIWSAVREIQHGQPVLIGRPIANTQFYIVDSYLQPVPIGVPGELLIGGDGVSRGYLNRPELTEKRFIPDEFQQQPGSRVYRTGDMARYLSNGEVEFLGRVDHQVKIRGYRIELGEIEAVLSRHAAVKQSVVTVHELVPGDLRLSAYVVLIKGRDPATTDLRSFLRKELPDFMIPSGFHFLETLPLTPNGKVDRNALPNHFSGMPKPEADVVAPRNDTEKALGRIWSELLGVECRSVKDDFFDLGGHSLLAVRLFAAIEKQFGKRLPLSTLFRARTLEQLASALQEEVSDVHWSSLAPIEARGSRAPLFLVHGAEGNVLLYRALARHLGDDQPVYGLQSKGLNGKDEPLETVEEMASHYIREIRAIQPTGPYHLGGYCLGGTIALAMAQQLEAHGEQVALVAMFETYNPSAVPKSPSRLLLFCHWFQNAMYHFANLLLIPTERRWKFLSEKWSVERERLRIRLEAWVHRVKRGQGSTDGLSYSHLALKRVNDQAVIRYQPRAYSGRVALFRPKEYFLGLSDLKFGWGDVLRAGLEVHKLPFYAKGMLVEPFVEVLAEELKRCF